MAKAKRGRPLGSLKKKKRGRPKGSLNKIMNITPIIKVSVRCSRCGGHYSIRTDKNNLHLYTPEIKAKWVCPICKR